MNRILTFNLLRKIDAQKISPNWNKSFRLKLNAKKTKARPLVITLETGWFQAAPSQALPEPGSRQSPVAAMPHTALKAGSTDVSLLGRLMNATKALQLLFKVRKK